MIIEIDFNSDEAIYLQLRNQIIYGIATSQYREGDVLPSVRSLAETVGINMHTVNKAYSVLRQDGFVKVDRRKGAVIAVDIDRLHAMAETENNLKVVLARALCRGMTREEIHGMVDHIFDEFTGES
ncbi:MAG: GntR family transcriptional regulator [Lachnospiraceae bacterium]|nr:GntR family transcriptional regulator [Lachnospiraceae bacterium]